MRDIHCHLLYGIDDGSKSLEESINILDKMYNDGFTDIIITPHYMKDTRYNANNSEKLKLFEELKNNYNKINLYLGNEVYVDEDMVSLIKNNEIYTLNNSKYLLMELPMNNRIKNIEEIIYSLTRENIIPVIAHPERYKYVQNDIKYLDKLKEMGVLFQGNYESLFDKYGKGSKKTLKKLLKNNYITFLGSDYHHGNTDMHSKLVEKKLMKILKDQNKVNDLINENILKVIRNEDI